MFKEVSLTFHLTDISNLTSPRKSNIPPSFLLNDYAGCCLSVLNRRESDEISIDKKAIIGLSVYYKLQ